MKKSLLPIFVLFFLSGCANFLESVTWENEAIHQVNDAEKSFYFSYPADATVSGEYNGKLTYKDCAITFGELNLREEDPKVTEEIKEEGNISYHAYSNYEGKLFSYLAENSKFNYQFGAEDSVSGVNHCIDLVTFMARSLTDQPQYVNKEYGFSVPILSDFEMGSLLNQNGVTFQKRIENKEIPKGFNDKATPLQYSVEISMIAFENDFGVTDLSQYVGSQYAGFSSEFPESSSRPGVYTVEENGDQAIRHFFMMSDDVEIIYEATLKVHIAYYNQHKEFFDKEFAEKIRIF